MRGRRGVALVAALAAAGAALVAGATPAQAAAKIDPERYAWAPTGWAWYYSNTKAGIDAYASANNMRVTGIEVSSTSPLKFAATMVHNSGSYARTSSWVTGQTVNSLLQMLPGKRLLDLERYVVSGQTRFAAVMVANPASNFHSYKWYVNATPSFIEERRKAFGGRIIDIDRRSTGRYDVIMVKNTGVDAKAWWYYYNRTPAQLKTLLSTNKARLVDLEPEGNGRFTAVMVKSAGEYWWWHYAATSAQVKHFQAQYGMRIYHLKPYATSNGTRYVVLLLNNLDSAGTKARQALWGPAGNAAFGFYVKRIDGGIARSLQKDKVFEPASMLKALHHVTAMRQVYLNQAEVTDDVTYFRHPSDPSNKNVCAYDDDGNPLTSSPVTADMSVVLSGMMKQSDNRMTDAIYNTFGRPAINAMGDSLGMTKTELNHRIGCTWEAAAVKKSNELTLADHGKIFEAVYRTSSPILGTGTTRDQFYSYMSRNTSRFETVVHQEGVSLGKSLAVRNAFIAALKGAYKPGGYGNGAGTCDATGCTHAILRSTGGGYLGLPVKSGGTTVYRNYVYGTFIDGTFDCGPGASTDCSQESDALGTGRGKAMEEMLRPQIRSALSSW
jgi:hypothetical protein